MCLAKGWNRSRSAGHFPFAFSPSLRTRSIAVDIIAGPFGAIGIPIV